MTWNTKVSRFRFIVGVQGRSDLDAEGNDYFVMAYLQRDRDFVRPSGFRYSHANE
jgi:hypothetical protein